MLHFLRQPKIYIWGMVFVLAAGCCLGASNCFADDAVMKIKEIKPIPTSETIPIDNRETPKEPHYFVRGTVDAVGDNWITINDHQFFIAPGASLGCGVGDFVGIQVNDEVQVTSCEPIRK